MASTRKSNDRHSEVKPREIDFRVFDTMLEGVQVLSHEWRYLYINAAAELQSRRPRSELMGNIFASMWPGIEKTHLFSVIRDCLIERTPARIVNQFVFPDGKTGWYELSIQSIPEGVLILSHDITDRKNSESQVLQLKRLYATLSQVNQTIVRTKTRNELFQSICDVSVQFGENVLAWIGLLNEETGEIPPIAAKGLDVNQWPFPIVNIARGSTHNSVIAQAISTSSVATSEDIQVDERTKSLHSHIRGYNFHSVAVVPFGLRGKTIGALVLVSDQTGFFKSKEEILLLEEMGLDISFALETMENDRVRRQWADAFEHCAHGIVIGDPVKNCIVTCNPAFAREQGAAIADLESVRFVDMYPVTEHAKIRESLLRCDREGSVQFESVKMRNDGNLYPVQMDIVAVKDENGHLLYRVATQQDITVRKKAEQKLREAMHEAQRTALSLRESQERFSKIFFSSTTGINIFRLSDGRSVDVNDAFLKMTGFSRNEVVGHTSAELRIFAEAEAREVWMRELNQNRSIHNQDVRIRTKSGEVRYAFASIDIIEIGGERMGLVIASDITERKLLAEAVARGEERYRLISENAADVIWVMDPIAGKFTYVSPSVEKLRGYTVEEVMNQPVSAALTPESQKAVSDRVAETLPAFIAKGHGTESFVTEVDQPCKDGSIVNTEVTTTYVFNKQGGVEIIGVSRDITERKRAEKALRVSEENFEKAFQSSPAALLLTRLSDGLFIEMNAAYCDIVGYSRIELIGHRTTEFNIFINPDDRRLIVAQLLEKRSIRNLETSIRHRSGSIKHVVASQELISFNDQEFILTSLLDITDRKLAEERMRVSEQRFRNLFETSSDAIFIVDIETLKLVSANQAASHLYGYTPEEFASMGVRDISAEPDKSSAAVQNRAAFVPFRLHRRKDGTTFPAEITASYFTMDGRELHTAFVRDITERLKAIEELRGSEERFRTALYSITDGVIMTDTGGNVVRMNPAAERMTGWSESAGAGKPIEQIFEIRSLESESVIEIPVPRVLVEGISIEVEPNAGLTSTDGKVRSISCSVSPIRDLQGAITGSILVFNDLTEHKSLEAQFRQAQKMEAIGRLAGGVARDYNNMIGVILGYAKLIEEELNPLDPLRKQAQTIVSAAERSANLTRQLLAFARKQVIAPVALSLNDSLLGLHKMLTRLTGEDVTLTTNLADDIWNIKIDPTQIDQILVNLCSNSRDAIDRIGEITIETSNIVVDKAFCDEHVEATPGEYVRLLFSDNGKGMDQKTLAKIFEPFFTTKPIGSGTGLGLATVFGIVKQNNGFITVDSQPGKGTTFRIYFPRHLGEVQRSPAGKGTEHLRGKETILVVEDERHLLDLTKNSLKMFGYTVITASSPGDALVLCEFSPQPFDLLITDVIMPGMNGMELRQRLSAMRPAIKTLFMSGYTADVLINRGEMNEDLQFLQKPFLPIELARKVRDILDADKKTESQR